MADPDLLNKHYNCVIQNETVCLRVHSKNGCTCILLFLANKSLYSGNDSETPIKITKINSNLCI